MNAPKPINNFIVLTNSPALLGGYPSKRQEFLIMKGKYFDWQTNESAMQLFGAKIPPRGFALVGMTCCWKTYKLRIHRPLLLKNCSFS